MDIQITLEQRQIACINRLCAMGTGTAPEEPNLTPQELIQWYINNYLRVKDANYRNQLAKQLTTDQIEQLLGA